MGSIPVAGAKHAKRRAFFRSRKVGIPLCETFGEGLNCRSDGNFTPLLILFPKIQYNGFLFTVIYEILKKYLKISSNIIDNLGLSCYNTNQGGAIWITRILF